MSQIVQFPNRKNKNWICAFVTLLRYSSKMGSTKGKISSWMSWTTVAAARNRSSSHSVLSATLRPPATSYWCPTRLTLAPPLVLPRPPKRVRKRKRTETLLRGPWGIQLPSWPKPSRRRPYLMGRLRPLWRPWARGRSPSRRRRRPHRC